MKEFFRNRLKTVSCLEHEMENLITNLIQFRISRQNSTGINIHVAGEVPVGFRVGAYFDDGRYRRANHRASACSEQNQMASTCYQLSDFSIIVDVGEPVTDIAVWDNVQ